MADILPSTGTYKVSAQVNGLSLDDCSFISLEDEIKPYFEESVSKDPDITALVVFLKNSLGEAVGVKVTYELDEDYFYSGENPDLFEEEDDEDEDSDDEKQEIKEEEIKPSELKEEKNKPSVEKENNKTAEKNEPASTETTVKEPPKKVIYKSGDELVFTVKTLNKKLPVYPLAEDLPVGRYSIVYQIMGRKQILQRTEKPFFYLADTVFSFESIQMLLPGVAENKLLIPKKTVIMLETKLDYDELLEPYIVWYDGKTIISEGKFSEGAGNILWEAPEQSGFFSLRAEVFPVLARQGLAGYSKNISLLVSSNTPNMHLISQDIPELLHCYLFEGNLKDSMNALSPEWALKPAAKTLPKWMPIDEIYGLAVGVGDYYTLPGIIFPGEEIKNWRLLFRFIPLNKGDFLSIQFGPSFDIVLKLSADDKNLILTLASPMETVSQEIELPQTDMFITAGIEFSVQPEQLLARFYIMDEINSQSRIISNTASLNIEVKKEYRITLGDQNKITAEGEKDKKPALAAPAFAAPAFAALWDEFALLDLPLFDEIIEEAEDELLEEIEELVDSYDETALEI